MAMKVFKWVISSAVLLCTSVNNFAQDMHFSMFDAAPIYFNPALVGKGECDHRFMLNSKTQWTNTYKIFSFSYDLMLPEKINNVLPTPLGGHWAAGVMLSADPSGTFNLTETKLMLMPAYHLPIGKIDLSAGLNIALINTSVDASEIKYYVSDDDVVQPNLDNTGSLRPDVSFGVNAGTYFKNKYPLNIGGTIHHFYTPIKGFSDGEAVIKPRRLSFNANTEIPLDTNNSILLYPSAIFYYQNNASVINTGSLARFSTEKYSQTIPGVYAGFFLRLTEDEVYFGIPESFITAVGIDLSMFKNGSKVTAQGAEKKTGDLRILFSYDLTINEKYNDMGKGGSFEISIKYTFCNKKFSYTPPFRLNPVYN